MNTQKNENITLRLFHNQLKVNNNSTYNNIITTKKMLARQFKEQYNKKKNN